MTLWLTKVWCVLAGSRKLKAHRVLLKSQWYKRTLRNFFDGSFKTTDDGYPFLMVFFNILIPFHLLNHAIDCKQFILGHFSSICLSFQSNKHIQRLTVRYNYLWGGKSQHEWKNELLNGKFKLFYFRGVDSRLVICLQMGSSRAS